MYVRAILLIIFLVPCVPLRDIGNFSGLGQTVHIIDNVFFFFFLIVTLFLIRPPRITGGGTLMHIIHKRLHYYIAL